MKQEIKKIASAHPTRIDWIPVGQIEVESPAQRPFNESWKNRLLTRLDPEGLGVIHVAEVHRNNGRPKYYAMDGQHRAAAVKEKYGPDEKVRCLVYLNTTLQDRARIFRELNFFKGPRPLTDFMVGLSQRDDECLAINAIVEGEGLKVGLAASDGVLVCVSTLRRAYRANPALLRDTLHTLVAAWGKEAAALSGDVIAGMAAFLAEHGTTIDRDAFTRKLQVLPGGASKLLGKGRTIREGMGGSIATCIKRALVMVYNSGKRTKALTDASA